MISKQSIENQHGGSRFYNLILLGKLALVCNEKQNKIINARSRVESAAAARTEHQYYSWYQTKKHLRLDPLPNDIWQMDRWCHTNSTSITAWISQNHLEKVGKGVTTLFPLFITYGVPATNRTSKNKKNGSLDSFNLARNFVILKAERRVEVIFGTTLSLFDEENGRHFSNAFIAACN